MPRRLSVTVERFPLAAQFTISRGSKTEAVTVVCRIHEDGAAGLGECVPYARYGESVESVVARIESVRATIEGGDVTREGLLDRLEAGAARNALDCALWDLEAKRLGTSAARIAGLAPLRAVETAYTISLASPVEMARATREAAGRPLLKIKLGAPERDRERMAAVRAAAPDARLVLDANEGWSEPELASLLEAAAEIGALLVEQPLPAGADALLERIPHPVPVCADESVHGTADLAALRSRYDFVNLKLDKTGGLTEGLRFLAEARRLRFGVMVGCMVGSSLAMAPATLLAQGAEVVDLDGPLLLRADRAEGLRYEGSTLHPPSAALWG